jgi:hypothetical protein
VSDSPDIEPEGRTLERREGDHRDHPAPTTESSSGERPFSFGGEELLATRARLAEAEMGLDSLREQVLGINLRLGELTRRLAALEKGRRR